jgi:ATP-dependent helicase/nuclease subunit B
VLIPPMPRTLKILPWDRPLLERTVTHFAAGWSGGGALDLSDRMIVVPTRQAGRRLRAALAVHAAERGGAVLAPRVLVPEQILDLAQPASLAVANRAQVLLAWAEVLRAARLEEFCEVFPVDPPERDFAWALRLAGEMARLQAALAEGGLRFADVAPRAGDGFAEPQRWEQLAQLERAVDAALAAQGVAAQAAVALVTANAPVSPPEGVRRVALLAVPDPLLAVLRVLESWSRVVDVEVLAFGPAAGAALFDDWGRPQPEAWRERALELEPFEKCVRLCADPAAQAAAIAAQLVEAKERPGLIAVGAADPEVLPLLAGELRAAGVASHLPEGRPLAREALAGLLAALQAAVRADDWASACALARRSEVLEFLARESGCAPERLLAGLDALHAEHLPPTLAEARRHTTELDAKRPGFDAALARLAELLEELRRGAFPGAWAAVLARLYAGRELDLARAEDRAFAEAAEAWRAAAAEVAAAAPARLAADEACGLALQLFGTGRLFDDKPAGAVELDGWLELAFRDEPVLLVAGLNDGCAPEAVAGHAFLPESLRERLGLKTNAQRFARDAWQLAALAASRATGGRLEVFLGKTSAAGDPLRPSRLLFQCAETELPVRVRFLFRELPPAGGNVAWRRAWRWRVPWVGAAERLRVTGFRDYLACPFRFYLKHRLKMEPVDAAKRELDAADFGTLVHRVLERLGQDVAWRDCTDGEKLAREFEATFDAVVVARFGNELSLPLRVQAESARQRLAAVARLQAGERAAGWVIQHTEWKLPAGKLSVGGIELSGTIDRIERHEATGAWRVLDYKTSETGNTPAEAHVRSDRGGRAWLAEARLEIGGKPFRWTDLQLPLYRWALGELLDARGATIGYFNLPKAVTETRIEMWEDFGDELQAAALRCAAAVGAGVKAGRHWPPVEEVDNDDFAALIHDGTAASFDVGDWPEAARGVEARGERLEARGGNDGAPGKDERRASP